MNQGESAAPTQRAGSLFLRCMANLKWTQKNIKISVGVIVLMGCATVSPKSYASTDPSIRPVAWTSDESSSSTTHSIKNRDTRSSEVSPFTPGSNNLALDLGQVFLIGGLPQNYTNSLGTQLHYTYGVSDLFCFDSSLGYSEHSSGQYSMLSVLTGLRMNLTWYDKVIPYGLAGLGFYRPYYQDNTVPASPTSGSPSVAATVFGMHLGFGADLVLTRNLFFGASLIFHNMFGTDMSWANGKMFSVGGAYASFFLHIGATF